MKAQAVQLESALECSTCDGTGYSWDVPACREHCRCGGRLCGFRSRRCVACHGTGVQMCSDCGSEPATVLVEPATMSHPDGWPYCATCARAQASEPDEQDEQNSGPSESEQRHRHELEYLADRA